MHKLFFSAVLFLAIVSGCTSTGPTNYSGSPASKALDDAKNTALKAAVQNIDTCLAGCQALTGSTGKGQQLCEAGCWSNEARNSGDISICDTKFGNDSSLQAVCYTNVAVKKTDPSVCEKIGKDANDILRVTCYSTLAKQKKDKTICDKITSDIMKKACTEDLP